MVDKCSRKPRADLRAWEEGTVVDLKGMGCATGAILIWAYSDGTELHCPLLADVLLTLVNN
jgi:hypothetical protein